MNLQTHLLALWFYKMVIIFRVVMDNYRYFVGHIKFWIANTVCQSSIPFCIMAVVSYFSIIYIFKEFFYEIFFINITYFVASSCDFNSLFVNGNIFVFSKPVFFLFCVTIGPLWLILVVVSLIALLQFCCWIVLFLMGKC